MSDAQRMMEEKDKTVHQVELVISVLLRVGVVVSLLVVVAGTVLSFVHHPGYLSNGKDLGALTKPGAAAPHSIAEVASGVRQWRGQDVVVAGLLLLIATPVMRVAVSIVAFLVEKDKLFALITAGVLALLLLSFFLGKAGG
ncbi:MAG TPA: DUF1634 domain-containing protein [Phycisphaerae bacterium]|nr:DUF1634 domain-containing protein [Phycisphaerae bacterium]